MYVIVGLGNPGKQYEGTRHNVGWEVLGELRARAGGGAVSSKFEADLCEVRVGEAKVLLAAPTTYMNLSGRSVRKIADFYKLSPAQFLVVCDDMNLETGRLRMRRSGSAGGQKGLKNICDQLATQDVPRLRVGVGRPPAGFETVDYVLGRFKISERAKIDEAVVDAAESCEAWVRDGIDKAMNATNGG